MEMTLSSTSIVLEPARAAAAPAPASLDVSEEQVIYAGLLDIGMKVGIAILLVTFTLYVLGVLQPVVPLQELPKYWSMPVGKYLAATGVDTGWSWVYLLHRGDFLNFAGIAFLSAVTIFCYLRILPISFRNGERVFAAILGAEALVLVPGASGILSAGH
jgi:hypothetical protein